MIGKEVRIVVPEPHYTLFKTTRDGLPEVVSVNDAVVAFAHVEIFPWHLRITIEAHDLAQDRMPASDESELLFDIADAIEEVVVAGRTGQGRQNALFLARSTWNGTRELRFQVHDPAIANAALKQLIAGREWPRHWDYEMTEDAAWRHAAFVFQLFAQADGHHS